MLHQRERRSWHAIVQLVWSSMEPRVHQIDLKPSSGQQVVREDGRTCLKVTASFRRLSCETRPRELGHEIGISRCCLESLWSESLRWWPVSRGLQGGWSPDCLEIRSIWRLAHLIRRPISCSCAYVTWNSDGICESRGGLRAPECAESCSPSQPGNSITL